MTKRTCGFGKGNRFQTPEIIRDLKARNGKQSINLKNFLLITSSFYHVDSPPPGTYVLPTDFDIGNPKRSRITKSGVYSFGTGHKAYQRVYLPNQKQRTLDTHELPGPGQYDTKIYTVGYDSKTS